MNAQGWTMEALNAMPAEDFCAALDGIWEHSPWVVEAVAPARPFLNSEALFAAMGAVVSAAPRERQLALLVAHPDLAVKLAVSQALTPESTQEQASAGLDRLTPAEFAEFSEWNRCYRETFGFPFIICVREHSKTGIRAAFQRRLAQGVDEEFRNALDEVRRIADYRLGDRVNS